MVMWLPPFHMYKSYTRCVQYLIKKKVVQGVYKGYNFDSDTCCFLFHGHKGWNLFINEDIDKKILENILQYLVKNKKTVLFIMRSIEEARIDIKVKL